MIKFFTNRELSQKLNVNLARWKRWSREFLPPDPLGGMQSGYARHYSIDEAFKVFLAGHLVSVLKFTIPEAQKILADLHDWLAAVGMYQNFGMNRKYDHMDELSSEVAEYIIFIQPPSLSEQTGEYGYTVRGIISDTVIRKQNCEIREERYVETLIPSHQNHRSVGSLPGLKMLNITAVFRTFMESLDLSETRYPLSKNL